jgi:SAM-dependent methyltransferase
MNVFAKYAQYYDLLYKDKEYKKESDFIVDLLREFSPSSKNLLEIGCGTGSHAALIAESGYSIHGIDVSQDMLDIANIQKSELIRATQEKLTFSLGDAQDFAFNYQFDSIISLFHVVSYQTTNENLINMFQNVSRHLKVGGVFIFDYWYGPAVLTDRPVVRVKKMESDEMQVIRIAEPVLYPNENVVNVNYDIFIRDKFSSAVEQISEAHRMRYLFATEIEQLAHQSGLKLERSMEWLTGQAPSFDTWGVCSVLKK